jgi:hypothetical protein
MTNRAAQRHRHPGRERPRGAGLGPPWRSTSGVAHAPSPTPTSRPEHERAAQFAALRGRHPMRQHLARRAVTGLGRRSRLLKAFAHRCDSEGRRPPPLLWGCVPLLGPPLARSDGLRRRRSDAKDDGSGDRVRGPMRGPAAGVPASSRAADASSTSTRSPALLPAPGRVLETR